MLDIDVSTPIEGKSKHLAYTGVGGFEETGKKEKKPLNTKIK